MTPAQAALLRYLERERECCEQVAAIILNVQGPWRLDGPLRTLTAIEPRLWQEGGRIGLADYGDDPDARRAGAIAPRRKRRGRYVVSSSAVAR